MAGKVALGPEEIVCACSVGCVVTTGAIVVLIGNLVAAVGRVWCAPLHFPCFLGFFFFFLHGFPKVQLTKTIVMLGVPPIGAGCC